MKKGVNVADACYAGKMKQMKDAGTALLKIFSFIQFLCMQALALRGRIDKDANITRKLHGEDVPELKPEGLARKDIINEMIELK